MLRKFASFVLMLAFTLPASGQKLGVVMSGGGAKGLYHIGVLEALETYGIPIDYVAGTSMGSIIAAMYAAGYSPAEMRSIVSSGVVREWVSGRIDPNIYMPYYRQIASNPAFVNLRVDVEDPAGARFVVPTNLISSTQIDMALTELFAAASTAAEGDFNRLMVPFLCVASDMNHRGPAVMRRGDLSEAVRSSMSIPLVFKPMTIDSMLLYDGGIYDNFPWKPLDEAFSPDLIIGSICTSGNTPPSEQNNLLDQAFLLAMHDSDYTLPEGRSVTIRRAVGVNMLDFDQAEAIMDAGYEDAIAAMPQLLERIPVGDRRDSAWFADRRATFRKRCPPLVFDNYDLKGLKPAQKAYVRDLLQVDPRLAGRQQVMDFAQLRTNLYRLLSVGDFSMDFPKARYDSLSGRYTFVARFNTRPTFKLTFGGNVSSTAFNQAYVGVSHSWIGRVSQRLGADLYLGPVDTRGTVRARAEVSRWAPLFWASAYEVSVANFRRGYFGNVSKVRNAEQVKSSESFLTFGVGMPVTHRSAFVLRANGGHVNYRYDSQDIFADDTDLTRFSFFGLRASIIRNTLDKFLYPRRGSDLQLSAIFVTGRDKYNPYDVKTFIASETRQWFGGRFTWNKYFDMPGLSWFSFGLNIDGVLTNQPSFQTESATLMAMPEYAPVSHMRMIYMPDYRAPRFVAGGLMPTFDLTTNFFFRTGFYAMYRQTRDYNPFGEEDRPWHYIAEASLVYHTPIGPVSLALTKYDLQDWKNMYLTFNFGYAIFAPKGTFY